MSVKVIKQKAFDVVGIVKSTFNPGSDIALSYPNYNRVTNLMLTVIELLSPVLKELDPKKSKGTFLWFKNGTPIFKFDAKTKTTDLEKFNDFYANFKKAQTFQEFFNFCEGAEKYLAYSLEEQMELGSSYKILYNSASGSSKCTRYFTPVAGDEASLKLLKISVELANRIRKIIVQIDKSDKASISLNGIFDSILVLVRKSNPRMTISKNINDVFVATYESMNEKLDEVYANYILTGSELGMFFRLVQGVVSSLQNQEGNKVVGVDDSKDEVLFKDLIKLLNGIKDAVMKEMSNIDKLSLSDERMSELQNTLCAISMLSDDPSAAVKELGMF